jgi:V/A-type H+-transporting ATPase subunit I
MKFVNIMGDANDINRVREKYLIKYDIQIEDAVKELSAVDKDISVYSPNNLYVNELKEIENIAEKAKVTLSGHIDAEDIPVEEASGTIRKIKSMWEGFDTKVEDLLKEKKAAEGLIRQVSPFIEIDLGLDNLYKLNFINYRFGRLPVSLYSQFRDYLYGEDSLIFVKTHADEEYIWGIYFVPRTIHERVDAIFSSLYFERVEIDHVLEKTPAEECARLKNRISEIEAEIETLLNEKQNNLESFQPDILKAYKKLCEQYNFEEMLKYTAKTKEGIYIIVGWMGSNDAEALGEEIKEDDKVTLIIKEPNIKSKPPTKLSNFILFRPFEFFVNIYGLPSYNEIDPTPFLGITYTLLFGIMFGDLGQGLLLALFGYLYYRKTRVPLGAILSVVGLSSAFFGAMFGSIFGYENIIPALWLRPLESMMDILIVTVSFGIILNICAIVIHIINSIRNKEVGSLLFDSNGLAGLFFYVFVIAAGLSVYFKNPIAPLWLTEIILIIPLILIMLREPLSNMVNKKGKLLNGSLSSYLMEAVFETFEILLSYVTNTISFVRVGAFALCHAGMMSVVLMLAGASHEHGGGNILVMIFGNIFVMALEGLIVGIQCLRLQYYEMFSRFFTGSGRAFKSFTSNKP